MSDIVERLQNHVNDRGGPAKDENGQYVGTVWPMMLEAADTIARLRSELDQAREAINDSQSLFSLILYIGSETPGITSLDWENENLTKLIDDQIAENRSMLSSTELQPTETR